MRRAIRLLRLAGLPALGVVLAPVVALLPAPAQSQARNVADGCIPRFRFVAGQTTQVHGRMRRNEVCYLTVGHNTVVRAQRVVKRARHGIYGVGGAVELGRQASAYQPERDFVGQDEFELQLDYEDRFGTLQRAHVKFTIVVAP